MIDLKRPIASLAADVRGGTVTAAELAAASLARIAVTDSYHTVLELNPHAERDANEVDARVAAGEDLPLAGIPFIAKDNFLTFDTHTTAASNILKPFKAPYEGPAIQRLKAAGAVLVAKANLDAFAHGSSTENSDFGPTKNPVDPTRVPGGSSGGSAAAVALGQACFALGTDTGGSVRLPASYCGVVGFKPTYGLIPRTGVVAMGSSVDVIGPLTNSVADTAAVLDVLAGRDASDATSIERDASPYTGTPGDLKGLKIGLVKEYMSDESGVELSVREPLMALVEQLRARGAVIEEVSIPSTEYALATYYILIPAEVSSNLARYDGVKYGHSSKKAATLEETYQLSRDEGFGAEAKRRILIGTYVLSSGYYDAYYKRAQKVRTRLIEDYEDKFKKFDLLLGLTAASGAFELGHRPDPLSMYLTDVMTVSANLVGLPAISIPFAVQELHNAKMPLGLQIIAPQRAERDLLAAAATVEIIIGDWSHR